MNDLWTALLFAGSALGLHLYSVMGLVAVFRRLPNVTLERLWAALGGDDFRASGWRLWSGLAIIGLYLAIATCLPLFMIVQPQRAAGTAGIVAGTVEVGIVLAWLGYLLLYARGTRR